MNTYLLTFIGRKIDAIGAFYPIVTEIKAESKEDAILKLYTKYEHVTNLTTYDKPWYYITSESTLETMEEELDFEQECKTYLNQKNIDRHLMLDLHEQARIQAVQLNSTVLFTRFIDKLRGAKR